MTAFAGSVNAMRNNHLGGIAALDNHIRAAQGRLLVIWLLETGFDMNGLRQVVTTVRRGRPPRAVNDPIVVCAPASDTTSTGARSFAESAVEAITAAGLVYVLGTEPGFRRAKRGKRFTYFEPGDTIVRDEQALRRIAALAIPPAYRDVWICMDPRGHLQATGYDARGRKQYRYHPDWRIARDGAKFDRMIEFGEALPSLRRRIRRDLRLDGYPRNKVLAIITQLLDTTRIRIGNAGYARDNNSFGLTTLKKQHLRFSAVGRATLTFNGKGGLAHDVALRNKRLVSMIRDLHTLPGQQLFQYVDESGIRRSVTSDQVNAYLKEIMGNDFTAKDFRTWGATMSAVVLMADTPLPESASERAFKACIVAAIKQVALELRNTPAVCRKSYINPEVFVAWRNGELHKLARAHPISTSQGAERAALAFMHALASKARKAAKQATRVSRRQMRANSHERTRVTRRSILAA